MGATDIVFLGHQQGLNSGILALAASYSKAIVYPDIGNFSEQVSGWKWCEPYEVGNIESAVAAFGRLRDKFHDFNPGVELPGNAGWQEKNSWKKHVEHIRESLDQRQSQVNDLA